MNGSDSDMRRTMRDSDHDLQIRFGIKRGKTVVVLRIKGTLLGRK